MSNTQLTAPQAQNPEDAAEKVEAAILEVVGKRLDMSPEANAFRLIQRRAGLLAASTLIPESFRNNPGNCAIALEIADRLGASPFMVMQNLYIVHGKPGWSAVFLIGMVNASKRFTPLQFKMDGEGGSRSCVAWAKDANGDVCESPPVDIKMAEAEGWVNKAGSKWKTMPEVMLRYRAASFFAKLYAPDITLGMNTAEELRDSDPEPMRNATPGAAAGDLPRVQFQPRETAPMPEPQHQAAQPEKPKTIAQRKDDALAAIEEALIGYDDVTILQFEGMLKRRTDDETSIGQTQTLKAVGVDRLERIALRVGEIINEARQAAEA